MDPLFIVEIIIVALIIVVQFWVFFRNSRAIHTLAEVYPPARALHPLTQGLEEESEEIISEQKDTVDLIDLQPKFSLTFQEVAQTTNAYLIKNKGAADFDILKELASQKVDAMERSIESNITLPLYIGLLCTFTGVIIGLIKIAMVGVSDAAIQSFIGGVLIGMVGSATGLSLTVRSNSLYKDAKEEVDSAQYDYFTFLRTHILPALKKEADEPTSTLRENLKDFHQGFARYQEHMNQSLEETLRLFRDLKDMFRQVRHLQQDLQRVGDAMHTNEDIMVRQQQYLDRYVEQAEKYSHMLGQHFNKIDRQLVHMVDTNLDALDNSAQAAYVKMDQYLSRLDDTERGTLAKSLSKDLDQVRLEVGTLQKKNLELQVQLNDQMRDQGETYHSLAQQITHLTDQLDKFVKQGSFTESSTYRMFVYAGVTAFMVVILSGLVYMINLAMA